MDSRELAVWLADYQTDPWWSDALDDAQAHICQVLYAVNGTAKRLEEGHLWRPPRPPSRKELLAKVRMLNDTLPP